MARQIPEQPNRVAVVVAGAGARGGYEAGALSVLVPRLRAAGMEPSMYLGTSAGAINAAIFAGLSHLSPADQAHQALEVWRSISVSDVFRSPILTSPGVAIRLIGQTLRVPGVRLTGVLDTEPLRRKAKRAIDWDRLRANVTEGALTLGIVVTSGADNRTVVVVDRAGDEPPPPPDDDRPIDYVGAQIGPEHVLASSAIPLLFPPIRIRWPTGSSGWYLDGGVRLNAPLKPALALGADRLVVVATHPVTDSATPAEPGALPPDVDDAVVRLLDAALIDRMIEDLRTLTKVNALVGANDGETAGGRRVIRYQAVGPPERETLGQLAAKVLNKCCLHPNGVVDLLRQLELHALCRALEGDGPRKGDLFSYLYFDREFIEESITLGQQHANDLLQGVPLGEFPWRT
jgi:NTE family protein